jgi:LysM repeat protein
VKVRIPPGTRSRFDSAFALLTPETLTGASTIITQKGATWASLGRKAKLPARVVSTYNPTVKASKKTGIIPAGTPVLIPTPIVVAAAMPVPDPSIERYGRGTSTYVVRSGDNLSVIANRYRTTPAAIMRLNSLKKPLIFPGQELLVSGRAARAKKSTALKE